MKEKLVAATALILLTLPTGTAQISGELQQQLDQTPDTERVDVIIITQENAAEQARTAVRNAGGNVTHDFNLINGVAVTIPKVAADNLADRDFVREIQPDAQVKTVLDTSTETVDTEEVWQQNITGENIDVAVLDTGIENDTDLNVEREAYYTGDNAEDYNGHGTHVAGIIASPDSQYRGVAYGADLYDVKVLSSSGIGSSSDIIAGLEWAVDNGAEVATLSLGAQVETCDGTSALAEAVNNAVEQGVVVTVAAGNSGPENQTLATPGCAERPITVGSSSDGEVSEFSSRGSTADGRAKPDVVAPGEEITSTYIGSQEYETLSGTSMATPHVAGAAALLLAENPDLTPSEIKNVTKSTATDLGFSQNTQGSGRINIYAAYQAVTPGESNKPSETLQVEAIGTEVNTTGEITAEFKVNASGPENATLNTTFYFQGAEQTVETGKGLLSANVGNLSTNTTYNWSAETTDGTNTSSTLVQTFSTATEENQTEENRTGNITGPLPPGIEKKEEKPPAFLRGLPAFLRPAFEFPGNFFKGIQNRVSGNNKSKKPDPAQKPQNNKPEQAGEKPETRGKPKNKSQKPENTGKQQEKLGKGQKPGEKEVQNKSSTQKKPDTGKPENKEKGNSEANASAKAGKGNGAEANAGTSAGNSEKEQKSGKGPIGKAKAFTGKWFAGFLG